MKKSNIKGSTCFYQFIITSCTTLHIIIGYKPRSWLNLTVATYLALAPNVSWSNTAGPPTPVAEDALFSCCLTDEN